MGNRFRFLLLLRSVESYASAIKKEVGTLMKLNHPYIIGVEDVFISNKNLQIVMEL